MKPAYAIYFSVLIILVLQVFLQVITLHQCHEKHSLHIAVGKCHHEDKDKDFCNDLSTSDIDTDVHIKEGTCCEKITSPFSLIFVFSKFVNSLEYPLRSFIKCYEPSQELFSVKFSPPIDVRVPPFYLKFSSFRT